MGEDAEGKNRAEDGGGGVGLDGGEVVPVGEVGSVAADDEGCEEEPGGFEVDGGSVVVADAEVVSCHAGSLVGCGFGFLV